MQSPSSSLGVRTGRSAKFKSMRFSELSKEKNQNQEKMS